MKLNLGCGPDVRPGYVNVDFRQPCDRVADLSVLPWPFENESAEEILMLDFLEHFPYRKTEAILQEVWRVLKPGGFVDIQVPDFDHCAMAILDYGDATFQCNACGWRFEAGRSYTTDSCMKCGQTRAQIQDAAIHRLYGGQDYEGNWHFTAFTKSVLSRLLEKNGFKWSCYLEEEHQEANWNFKVRAEKNSDPWGDNG